MRRTGRAPRRTDEATDAEHAAQTDPADTASAARTDPADTASAAPAEPAPAPPAATGPPAPEGEAPAPDAPTAPTGPDTRIPVAVDTLWTSPAAPDRPIRLRVRMSRTDPMSVLMTSFLLAAGLVVCAAVTLPPLWIVLSLLDQDVLLPPLWQLGLAIVGVVVFTVFATVCALCYNLSARCVGGIDLALAEALPDTKPPDPGTDPDPDPEPGAEQDPGPEPATAAAPSGS